MFAASIQGEGVLAKSKSQSSLGTMQARFPTGEPISGCGSCVLDTAPHWLFRVGSGYMPHRMVSYYPQNQSQCPETPFHSYLSPWSTRLLGEHVYLAL